MAGLQTGVETMETAQATLRAQLDAAETQSDADQDAIATLQAGMVEIATLQADVDRIAELQAEFETVTAAQTTLEAEVSAGFESSQATQEAVIATRTGASRAALAELQGELATLQTSILSITQALEQNSLAIQALGSESSAEEKLLTAEELELIWLQAIELVTRSRLSLAQNDLELAREDIQAGRDLLAAIQTQVPDYQVEALADIVSRLDVALRNLPDRPAAAADEMEAVWQLLIEGPPSEPATATATVTPTATATATARPTATARSTPTPSATPTATPAGP
jgi:chromosome segregation ATPase